MKRKNQFDEVMIVNPSHGDQRVRLMRFHNVYPPELSGYGEPETYGYYAEPEPYGYYAETDPTFGYYAEVDPAYGYYAEVDPTVGYYGEVDPLAGYYGEVDPAMGYYAQAEPAYGYYGEVDPTVGYYGQVDPNYGYYAQAPEFAGVNGWGGYGHVAESDPVGYYAEEAPMPMGYYGEGPPNEMGYYGEPTEMVGYGEQEFAEEYPGISYYGEPDYSGYTREDSSFNPGCPLPTNVNGYDEADLAGYSRPATVNPSCDQFTSQTGSSSSPPETFKPLW